MRMKERERKRGGGRERVSSMETGEGVMETGEGVMDRLQGGDGGKDRTKETRSESGEGKRPKSELKARRDPGTPRSHSYRQLLRYEV